MEAKIDVQAAVYLEEDCKPLRRIAGGWAT
jgi:hypothetical protein